MDEDLRPAIDRLIASGGRLTIHGAPESGATTIVLRQAGVRFGILEVHGTATVEGADAETIAALQSLGWADPTVTHRLGREVRLHPADATDGRPATYTRTWRVPPTLASEIADAVRSALGVVGRVEIEPLPTRERLASEAALAMRPPTEERDLEPPEERRPATRAIPRPVRVVFVVALMGAIGFVWAGMIRGAPRLPATTTGQPSSAVAVAAPTSAAPTPAPPTSTSAVPAPDGVRSHLIAASTEDESGPAAAAVDGDPVTAWHAAFGVPQWIEIGLDAPSTVTQVVLLIAQSEDGPSRHMIQVAVTGQALQVLGVVDQSTTDGDAIVFRPDTPIPSVERIRIETMASPSNAGWYEVIVR